MTQIYIKEIIYKDITISISKTLYFILILLNIITISEILIYFIILKALIKLTILKIIARTTISI